MKKTLLPMIVILIAMFIGCPMAPDLVVERNPDNLLIVERTYRSSFGSYTDMWFFPPSELGATSYTLQTSADGTTGWTAFQYYSDDLVTGNADQDNFSVDLGSDTWIRLVITGGEYDGQVSNKVFAPRCTTDSYVSNWGIDESQYITGVQAPRVGYGLTASFIVKKASDNTVLSNVLTYQWYRVNPEDWEDVELISGATGLNYTTTDDDKGHHMMIKATGNDIDFDGICVIMSDYIVN